VGPDGRQEHLPREVVAQRRRLGLEAVPEQRDDRGEEWLRREDGGADMVVPRGAHVLAVHHNDDRVRQPRAQDALGQSHDRLLRGLRHTALRAVLHEHGQGHGPVLPLDLHADVRMYVRPATDRRRRVEADHRAGHDLRLRPTHLRTHRHFHVRQLGGVGLHGQLLLLYDESLQDRVWRLCSRRDRPGKQHCHSSRRPKPR